jgi:hypothetical protein
MPFNKAFAWDSIVPSSMISPNPTTPQQLGEKPTFCAELIERGLNAGVLLS